jgi:selenocysteine lyase/cysteine desulfurase
MRKWEIESPPMIYLNNAAAGWPKAPGVSEAVRAALEAPPDGHGRASGESRTWIDEARRRVARLLSVDNPSRIVFTLNATHALNMAFQGLDLPRASLVVTSAASHNSVLRPLAHMRAERGVRLKIVPADGDGRISLPEYEEALRQGPALVALTHASNVTGAVDDASLLLRMAKVAGAVTLLDASQSVGHVPISPVALAADLIAFQAHKALHGPEGAGVLYAGESVKLKQVVTGGTGVRSDLELHPSEMPTRLEAGTPNLPALAGLAASLEWFESDGHASARRASEHASRLRQAFSTMANVRLIGAAELNTTPVVSFRVSGMDVEECGFILRESFGVVARTGLHCAPLIHAAIGTAPRGTVRFSPSGFNTSDEVEAAISAVAEVARCA